MTVIKKAFFWLFFPAFLFCGGVVLLGVMLLEKDIIAETTTLDEIEN